MTPYLPAPFLSLQQMNMRWKKKNQAGDALFQRLFNPFRREAGLGFSFFSRPATGCIVKGQDRAGRRIFLFRSLSFLLFLTSVGSTCVWHACIIGAWLLNDEELARACRSSDQWHDEVWPRGGVVNAREGGARSGSVSRLISHCHSATVGSEREKEREREGAPEKKHTGIGWLWRTDS